MLWKCGAWKFFIGISRIGLCRDIDLNIQEYGCKWLDLNIQNWFVQGKDLNIQFELSGYKSGMKEEKLDI